MHTVSCGWKTQRKGCLGTIIVWLKGRQNNVAGWSQMAHYNPHLAFVQWGVVSWHLIQWRCSSCFCLVNSSALVWRGLWVDFWPLKQNSQRDFTLEPVFTCCFHPSTKPASIPDKWCLMKIRTPYLIPVATWPCAWSHKATKWYSGKVCKAL